MSKILIGILCVVIAVVSYYSIRFYKLGKISQTMSPANVGVKDGKLLPCGPKPNCYTSDLKFSGTKEQFRDLVIEKLGGSLVTESSDYLHFEMKSTVFGFVDDTEFYFAQPGVIHVRSASRVGHSDLGANKERVERLRKLLSN